MVYVDAKYDFAKQGTPSMASHAKNGKYEAEDAIRKMKEQLQKVMTALSAEKTGNFELP
jgi:hypothetical protein